MSPLAELLDAVRRGDTLAWALVHAPDGDADGAVRRAWEGETNDDVLIALRPHSVAPASARPHKCDGAMSDPGYQGAWLCPQCCEDTRAAVTCPTWAELTATKGREG